MVHSPYISPYIIVLFPIVAMAGAFFGPRLQAKTELGNPKIVWGKFLKYGLVLSAAFAVALTAEAISQGRESFPTGVEFPISAVYIIAGSLFLGFSFAFFWWAYPFLNSVLQISPAVNFKRSFFFEKVKTGPAWSTFWAGFFTIPYFIIIAIVRAREGLPVLFPHIIVFMVTIIGGILWDISRMHEIKKWIDGDKVVLPSPFSNQSFPAFLRSYLIGATVVMVPGFIAETILGATDEIWGALVLGVFLGASAHRYIWVHLYQKRNGIQLVHEVSDLDQAAAESVA